MTDIRQARFTDIPQFVDLAREAFERSRFSAFSSLDVEAAKRYAMEAIHQQGRGRSHFLVAESDGNLVGCFMGSVSPLYATDTLVASNEFFFTSDRANPVTALRLIRAFMKWAETSQSKVMFRFWMYDAVSDLAKLDRAMSAMGLRLAGGIYEKENF